MAMTKYNTETGVGVYATLYAHLNSTHRTAF